MLTDYVLRARYTNCQLTRMQINLTGDYGNGRKPIQMRRIGDDYWLSRRLHCLPLRKLRESRENFWSRKFMIHRTSRASEQETVGQTAVQPLISQVFRLKIE